MAANNNNLGALRKLSKIYFEGKYVKRDINKVIHYLTLASKQNDPYSQFHLGYIFYEKVYVPFDFNKALYYFTLSAEQNYPPSQYILGEIYYTGLYVPRDVEKGIHYLKISADQNNSDAQFYLGYIYFWSDVVPKNVDKSIHYLTLSANQSKLIAQHYLGLIYSFHVIDAKKAIYYLTVSADNSYLDSEIVLSMIYGNNDLVQRDVNKSFYYLQLAADKNNVFANFLLGFHYCYGENVHRNFDAAIKYFKRSSSFSHQYSKNNLGVIYRIIKNDLYSAELYFDEAIRLKNDVLSMFNLAHMYFYEKEFEDKIDKSIELLIKSPKSFSASKLLLIIIIMKKIPSISLENIEKELIKFGINSVDYCKYILDVIIYNKLNIKEEYDVLYSQYEKINFFYIFNKEIVFFSDILKNDSYTKQNNLLNKSIKKDINDQFYEGFYN